MYSISKYFQANSSIIQEFTEEIVKVKFIDNTNVLGESPLLQIICIFMENIKLGF